MQSYKINVNGSVHSVLADPDTPLLWVLRDALGLTGTKYGCGEGQCGACTVHLNGAAVRSCIFPVSKLGNGSILTIEGLAADRSHPIQQAWIDGQVPQCGYCQSGQIMTAVSLLSEIPDPSDEDIDRVMSDILCRCGTYQRIRRAIHRVARGAK